MNERYLFRGKRKDNGKWAQCLEFPRYGVNKNGDVCSFDYNHTGKTKEIRQNTDKDGYKYVRLTVDGKKYKKFVHRLVLSAFIPNPLNKPQVNHKNGIRNDNRLENLEWVTAQENCLHAYRCNGRKTSSNMVEFCKKRFCGENNPKSKLSFKQVSEMRKTRPNMSLKELSGKYNISIAQCSAICNYKSWDNPELLEVEK